MHYITNILMQIFQWFLLQLVFQQQLKIQNSLLQLLIFLLWSKQLSLILVFVLYKHPYQQLLSNLKISILIIYSPQKHRKLILPKLLFLDLFRSYKFTYQLRLYMLEIQDLQVCMLEVFHQHRFKYCIRVLLVLQFHIILESKYFFQILHQLLVYSCMFMQFLLKNIMDKLLEVLLELSLHSLAILDFQLEYM